MTERFAVQRDEVEDTFEPEGALGRNTDAFGFVRLRVEGHDGERLVRTDAELVGERVDRAAPLEDRGQHLASRGPLEIPRRSVTDEMQRRDPRGSPQGLLGLIVERLIALGDPDRAEDAVAGPDAHGQPCLVLEARARVIANDLTLR